MWISVHKYPQKYYLDILVFCLNFRFGFSLVDENSKNFVIFVIVSVIVDEKTLHVRPIKWSFVAEALTHVGLPLND